MTNQVKTPNEAQQRVYDIISKLTNDKTGTYSGKRLSQLLGVSEATISLVKNKKWDEVKGRMWEYLYNQPILGLRKSELSLTRNIRRIELLCDDAQETARMVACAAYTGAGKTTAFEWVAYASGRENVFYVLGTEAMNVSELFRKIGRSMGLELEGRRPSDMIDLINQRLLKTTKPLLIIDDAGKLNDACIRHLQIVYDYTKGYCGIVLAGTEYLKKTITRKATLDKRGFREFKRRIELWVDLYRPSLAEIQDRCEKRGLSDEKNYMLIAKASGWHKDEGLNEANFGSIENAIGNLLRANAKNTNV